MTVSEYKEDDGADLICGIRGDGGNPQNNRQVIDKNFDDGAMSKCRCNHLLIGLRWFSVAWNEAASAAAEKSYNKIFFLAGRPRRMFWFSLRFQEFSWWKNVSILTTQCDMRIQNQQITKTYTIFIVGWTNENGKIYWRESRIGHGQGRGRGGCLRTTWNQVQVALEGAQHIWGKATHGMPCKIGQNALWYMRVMVWYKCEICDFTFWPGDTTLRAHKQNSPR